MNTYLIQIRGLVYVDELNPMSPHHMLLIEPGPPATRVRIDTDQSGLIGMMIHLNNLGFEIQSVHCEAGTRLSSQAR